LLVCVGTHTWLRHTALLLQGGSQPAWLQYPAMQVSAEGQSALVEQVEAIFGTQTCERHTSVSEQGGLQF
jgi:hypothetical protein